MQAEETFDGQFPVGGEAAGDGGVDLGLPSGRRLGPGTIHLGFGAARRQIEGARGHAFGKQAGHRADAKHAIELE